MVYIENVPVWNPSVSNGCCMFLVCTEEFNIRRFHHERGLHAVCRRGYNSSIYNTGYHFLKNLSCEQPATTGNWSMNNSSILQQRTNSHQSPSMLSNQHPELLQERHRSFSPMPSYVPDTPTFGIVKLPQQWFGIAMSVRLEFGVMNGTV